LSIRVQKYGGTSVGTAERIEAVADRIIATKQEGYQMVVVVSAMGDTTDYLVELAQQLSRNNPSPREYDALVSTGENVSAALLSMSLIAKGCPAISLSGPQAGVQTESLHNKAKILTVEPTRIKEELNAGKVVVVTGFQGINALNDITTIGRGGSDTSAVVLAAALGLDECEIFTDVVFTPQTRAF
jgi:aspartate kinase